MSNKLTRLPLFSQYLEENKERRLSDKQFFDNNNINIGDYGKFRITGPTGAFNVTGFAGGCDGRELIIYNNSGQTMTVEHNEGSSLAANRIASGAGDIVIPHVGSCTFDYDDTSNRWRVRSFVN